MKILDCNSDTGNLITDKTARITFCDRTDSIYNHYVKARVIEGGKLKHFIINGVVIPPDYKNAFYIALWSQFLSENKNLTQKILSYDEYEDGTPDGVVNSTARIFRILKSYGINGLKMNCKEFLSWLRKEMPNAGSSEYAKLKHEAETIIKEYYDTKQRSEIIEMAKEKGGKNLVRIMALLYDKKAGLCSDAYITNELKKVKRQILDNTNE